MTTSHSYPQLVLSPKTAQTYADRGARIAQRLAAEAGSLDMAVVVATFLASGPRFAQRTFRLYKACLLEHLARQDAPPLLLKQLREATSKDCPKKGGDGTSGKKLKKVSLEDRRALLAKLRTIGTRSAILAADYFEAGLIVGPRPVEWVGAVLSALPRTSPMDAPPNATHLLELRNAKRDEQGIRGNGEVRLIYVSLTSHQAALITRVAADATAHTSDWSNHYTKLRSALRYAARTLWPQRAQLPCFYTTRHQSQADAKASGMPLAAIAAVYGHASDNTSTKNYARKSQGDKNMCKVSPTAVSLERVRNIRAPARREVRTPGKNL